MHYIDLTLAIDEHLPVDPADDRPAITPQAQVDIDGYTLHNMSIGSHTGTHIDAPLHMIAGGKHLGQIDISQFIGRGRLIKVIDKQFSLEAVKTGGVQPGDIVLFYTGMSERPSDSGYFTNYPAIPEDVARYLVEQKVKLVGVDAAGPDHAPFPVHKILLSAGVLIAENLANLGKLIGKTFTVYALPLNIPIDGSPARIIAAVEE